MVKTTTCDTAQNNYTAAKITMANAQSNYEQCVGSDASYAALDKTLQLVVDPTAQRISTAQPILNSINDQSATYASLITSTKALIAATQPLTDYKSILEEQLAATLLVNASMKQQITSDANTTMLNLASTPDLSNGGPFGTANVQQGVLYGLLSFYSLFFILLSVVIYLKLKNSMPSYVVILGILVLLAGAGVGAYYLAFTSFFIFDVQSLVTSINL